MRCLQGFSCLGKRYQGRDICYGHNEETVTIYDVTSDKKIDNQTKIISRVLYEGAESICQGQALDILNQEVLFLDEEFEEIRGVVGLGTNKPPTHIVQNSYSDGGNRKIPGLSHAIRDLKKPLHRIFQREIYDISSIPSDLTGNSVYQAASFDTFTEDDDFLTPAFFGTWPFYAGLKSGWIFVHTIERGSFVLRATDQSPAPLPVCNADDYLEEFRADSMPGRLEELQDLGSTLNARQRGAWGVRKTYASEACTRTIGVAAQVSSAFAFVQTA
ncbi:hypothetical protein JHW43_007702 [Diplocarpon mali]|nr:hypothetical protein JHW43_007702 [Diplocarpon mali]